MRPNAPRPATAGPDSGPASPFPIKLAGPVIKGFGRGSSELGVPTANIPPEGLEAYPDLETGVYYGLASLDPKKFNYHDNGCDQKAFPCVLSIGYNPFYKNTVRSIVLTCASRFPHLKEIHLMRPFNADQPSEPCENFFALPLFYSTPLNLLVLGYIRPEYDYVSREALIEDIRVDCEVAVRSLKRPAYRVYIDGGDTTGKKEVEEARRWLGEFAGGEAQEGSTDGNGNNSMS
ncbi:hypothetical protein KEM55_008490 [Ascosphaera atra]|nr:hypothetical protein KEM55_008490 [Ascosphaera atra]